jgi:hypothetical protein
MILLEVDPDLVKPGWTPLIITVLLGIAVVLLFVSMRRQFRKISIPREDEVDDVEAPPADESSGETRDASAATTNEAPTTREDPPPR